MQSISPQEFVEKLQELASQPVFKVIHPADGWLFIYLGKRYQDYVSNALGQEEPYIKGQYQLFIKGKWKISRDGNIVSSSNVKKDETQEEYFTRMEETANNFPFKAINEVQLQKNTVVFIADNKYQMTVDTANDRDDVSLTIVNLDSTDGPVGYTHFRYDEEVGSLVQIKS